VKVKTVFVFIDQNAQQNLLVKMLYDIDIQLLEKTNLSTPV